MNEQIKQLAQKAGFATAGDPEYFYAPDYNGICSDELEKFAQLIIRECIRIPYKMWDKAELNADIAVKIDNRIKNEFGIE